MDSTYQDMIRFHGHSCPGLAIGYRMTNAGLNYLHQHRAEDEELVAIVENNACGVDALQFISGCTFGKGNFIFKDYGKHVYTFYDRKSRKGVRISFNQNSLPENLNKDRDELINWILNADEKDIVCVSEVHIEEPEPARIFKSIPCSVCGEATMETRTRDINGKPVCIPCAEK
jgi:formylmethanofuran dehydrogenase subunit E